MYQITDYLSVNKVLMLANNKILSGMAKKQPNQLTNLRIALRYVQRIHTGPCVAFQYRTLFIDYPYPGSVLGSV